MSHSRTVTRNAQWSRDLRLGLGETVDTGGGPAARALCSCAVFLCLPALFPIAASARAPSPPCACASYPTEAASPLPSSPPSPTLPVPTSERGTKKHASP